MTEVKVETNTDCLLPVQLEDRKMNCQVDHQNLLCQSIKDEPQKGVQIKEEQNITEQEIAHSYEFQVVKSEEASFQNLYDGIKEEDVKSELHEPHESDSEQPTEDSSDMDSDDDGTKTHRTTEKSSSTQANDSAIGRPTKMSESKSREHLKRKCNQKMASTDKEPERVQGKRKPHKCATCGEAFRYKADWKRHRLTHFGERTFRCPVCDKAFKRKRHMTSHRRSHTGQRPFSCPVCEEGFAEKSSLTKHVKRAHPEERPFRCPVCQEGFGDCDGLKAHGETHGEREHSCSECGVTFRRHHHLLRHMTVHSGERPFSCADCNRPFSRKDHLRSHMKVHTRPESVCPVCKMRVAYKYAMKKHMRNEHGAV